MTRRDLSYCFLQFQRRRIDAVAQSGRLRAIVEHMAQMRPAIRAQYLGAAQEQTAVLGSGDLFRRHRLPETRPAAARIELGRRVKQRCAAAHAAVGARLVTIVIRAGERRFGPFLPTNSILFRGELRAPFGVSLADFGAHDWSS